LGTVTDPFNPANGQQFNATESWPGAAPVVQGNSGSWDMLLPGSNFGTSTMNTQASDYTASFDFTPVGTIDSYQYDFMFNVQNYYTDVPHPDQILYGSGFEGYMLTFSNDGSIGGADTPVASLVKWAGDGGGGGIRTVLSKEPGTGDPGVVTIPNLVAGDVYNITANAYLDPKAATPTENIIVTINDSSNPSYDPIMIVTADSADVSGSDPFTSGMFGFGYFHWDQASISNFNAVPFMPNKDDPGKNDWSPLTAIQPVFCTDFNTPDAASAPGIADGITVAAAARVMPGSATDTAGEMLFVAFYAGEQLVNVKVAPRNVAPDGMFRDFLIPISSADIPSGTTNAAAFLWNIVNIVPITNSTPL